MITVGFNRLTRQSPNHLALVTGDGRHWTREELLAQCLQLQAYGVAAGGAATDGTLPSPQSSGRWVALNLASTLARGDGESAINSPDILDAAVTLVGKLGLAPGNGNVHYLGADLDSPAALQLALCALHCGHPLIVAGAWQLDHFLQAVAQYRVSYCYLSSEQHQQLLSLANETRQSPSLASLQVVLHPGTPGLSETGDRPRLETGDREPTSP